MGANSEEDNESDSNGFEAGRKHDAGRDIDWVGDANRAKETAGKMVLLPSPKVNNPDSDASLQENSDASLEMIRDAIEEAKSDESTKVAVDSDPSQSGNISLMGFVVSNCALYILE
jgi:hypothetical protein